MIELSGICFLLFVFVILLCCFIRYLYLKSKLLEETKKQIPVIHNQITMSRANFTQFIKNEEDTGNKIIDVLRIRARESRRFSQLFLIGFLMFLVIMFYFVLQNKLSI